MLTPEQIEARRHGLGGSEIAAALGLAKFGTPLSVYLAKKGLSTFEGNAMTAWGERMEPVAREWYAEVAGAAVHAPGKTYRHATLPAVASPDAFVYATPRSALADFKCPRFLSADDGWGPAHTEQVPTGYALQLQWTDAVLRAADVFHADELHLVAMVPGELRIYRLRRDEELQATLLREGAAWWERHIVADMPPPLDGSEVASEWLRTRFPRAKTSAIREASPREVLLLEALQQAEADKRRAEHDYELSRQLVEEAIGSDAGIKCGVGRVTWKSGARGRTFKTKWSNEGESDDG